jgi:hypothetical protein
MPFPPLPFSLLCRSPPLLESVSKSAVSRSDTEVAAVAVAVVAPKLPKSAVGGSDGVLTFALGKGGGRSDGAVQK